MLLFKTCSIRVLNNHHQLLSRDCVGAGVGRSHRLLDLNFDCTIQSVEYAVEKYVV